MPPSSATARWKPIVAQRRRGERRDPAELAAGEDARGRIGQLLVDAQLELAARQQARARDVAGLEGVLLAHVEDDEVVAAAVDARAQLGHAHERDVARRLGEQLRDRLAAAHVGAQRLGQVGRHRRGRGCCIICDELGAVASSAGAGCRRSRRRSSSGCGPCSRAPGRPGAPGRAAAACRTGCRRARRDRRSAGRCGRCRRSAACRR